MSNPSDGGDSDSALPQGDRLRILSPEELDLLWGRPRFSRSEREIFFALNARETVLLQRLRTARTRAHFLLQLGYFRARQLFFALDRDELTEDLAYVREVHLDGAPVPDLDVSEHTRQNHVALILEHHGFRLLERPTRAELERRALRAARISNRPLHVLRDLVDHLRRERAVLPGYSYLQDLVRRALAFERNRLADALQDALSADDERRLDELLADGDGLHAVTRLKHHPRDHGLRQINREIRRGESLRPLFAVAERIVAQAKLSLESVRFYASLVDYYTVYKLKRMEPATARLYLLCFVRDRYRRLNDHLIDAFRALVRRYLDEAAGMTKEALLEHRRQAEADLEQGVSLLRLYVDPAIDDGTAFGAVRARARASLPIDRLARLCDHLAHDGALDELAFEWQAIDTLLPRAKRNLRPLLRFLRFDGTASQTSRLQAAEAMAEAFRTGKAWSEAALRPVLVADRHRRHLFDASGTVRRDRYEFLIYQTLRDALESGDVFCSESVHFRSFEDDLVDEATFARRSVLLPELGVVAASTPIEHRLGELRRTLDSRFEQVNGRIRRGENPLAQLRHGRLVWGKVRGEENPVENEPLFDAVERIDVAQLLVHIDRRTRFLDAFEHVTGRGQHRRARGKPITVAALLAFATNIGLGRMAEISNLSRGQLATAATNFVRLETLREANDRLANATAKLPIFRHFDIGRIVRSSSDGQRFESAIPTINARHSAKYFGLKKGVVAYTLLASHVPLSARIIGANAHESHHVFDVLFNNLTDIRPETHSTDTHGTNQVNFALLHLFGYDFAPRYRDFREKVRTALWLGMDSKSSRERTHGERRIASVIVVPRRHTVSIG